MQIPNISWELRLWVLEKLIGARMEEQVGKWYFLTQLDFTVILSKKDLFRSNIRSHQWQ